MQQVTLRLPDALARQLKDTAAGHGRSVNAYCQAVLGAATDPDFAGDEAERVRERLARAGLLAPSQRARRGRGAPADVAAARKAAGAGRPLADLVGEGR